MTITTAGDALVQAILADPGDDGLRLIYADWLDDNGQPERAEFIRVQCELARPDPMSPFHPVSQPEEFRRWLDLCRPERVRHYDSLRDRERKLLLAHCLEWAPVLRPGSTWEVILSDRWQYTGTPGCRFRRGFVAEVHAPLSALLKHLPALVRAHPLERAVPTDRRPTRSSNPDGGFSWDLDLYTPGPSPVSHDIPPEWFNLLGGALLGSMTRWFPTESAAFDALSVALLTLARRPQPRECPACRGTGKEQSPVYDEGPTSSTAAEVVGYRPIMNSNCPRCGGRKTVTD